MAKDENQRIDCLLLAPDDSEYLSVHKVLSEAAVRADVRLRTLKDRRIRSFADSSPRVHSAISNADLVVADVSQSSPTIAYQLGVAHATGRPVVVLADGALPTNFIVLDAVYLRYDRTRKGLDELSRTFRDLLDDFKASPGKFLRAALPSKTAQTPFIDLGKLQPREFENLCFELLRQIGFRRVEWGTDLRGVDAVATLRKKDPDGYEYQELWLISMGIRGPLSALLEVASDPMLLHENILRRREAKEISFGSSTPVTFLFIPFSAGDKVPLEVLERETRRLEIRLRDRQYPYRMRVWNSEHLVNLIQQYPQLALKYFSEGDRDQSKHRKTPEELYAENVALAEKALLLAKQQEQLITSLREEKDKRISAERDAVWKELSFATAHKLGNPVFALETDLQGLKKRLNNQLAGEAIAIAGEMSVSIEKAKTIIEQFKSLTKAQEISPQPIAVESLVQSSCRIAAENGVEVDIRKPSHLPQVLVDPGRIAECFDELVANALQWFDKHNRKIIVTLDVPRQIDLPEPLDRSHSYVRIRFADNGCGVRADLKRTIFDPFFTTHPHGTGLGLSLVERIVAGHGGFVLENGTAGEGAVFEMYLPTAPASGTKE